VIYLWYAHMTYLRHSLHNSFDSVDVVGYMSVDGSAHWNNLGVFFMAWHNDVNWYSNGNSYWNMHWDTFLDVNWHFSSDEVRNDLLPVAWCGDVPVIV